MRSIIVAVGGPSGSGKSATVAQLARRFGWTPLEEAYCRLSPRPKLTWRSQGALRDLELRLLEEEARRFLEARSLAASGRTVVADTPFLDPVAYTAGLYRLGLAGPETFRAVVERAGELADRRRLGVPDLTVRLSVPSRTRRARISADPEGHPRALRDRHEAVGRLEAALVVPCFRTVLPGCLRVVRAVVAAETVADRIHAMASRTPPLHDPSGAARKALDALARRPAFRAVPVSAGNLKRRTPSPRPPR